MKDAGFVEVGSSIVFDEALQSRIGTEDGEEGIVVDEERFGLGSRRGEESRSGVCGVSGQGFGSLMLSAYCDKASLCRLIRCRLRVSFHGC